MNQSLQFLGKPVAPYPNHQWRPLHKIPLGQHHGYRDPTGRWNRRLWIPVIAIWWLVSIAPSAMGMEGHTAPALAETNAATGHPIPGASFQVFVDKGEGAGKGVRVGKTQADEAATTVVEAFTSMVQNRTQYPRFDEALTKGVLQKVVIEPRVFNRDGKEFQFLVARTKHKGQVNLLINASELEKGGYTNHPEKLVPVLAREFQWVISKASPDPKPKRALVKRDLKNAPIKTNSEIRKMSGEEREQALLALFTTYVKTVDDFKSLQNQPYYVGGTETLTPGAQPDSTTKFYDVRVREALQLIVRDPYFWEHTPKAVRSLLNGKVWNVTFAKIDARDWATRTRVAPKDKAVTVGEKGIKIQPAKVLVNYHRTVEPEDPFYAETDGLPMGALSTDQLARVIAWEIQNQITEKSMRGHVAQDEESAPE